MIVTENQLDVWVRGNARDAQGVIVELVARLVAASSPSPKDRRFPLGDSIGQTGPDGELDTDFGSPPFVPEGRSYWEIGAGENPGAKATSDYNALTTHGSTAIPASTRMESTFIFVTPLSATRGWHSTAQAKWIDVRKQRGDWKDVRVIDATKVIDWLRLYPAVEVWLAKTMRLPVQQIDTPEWHWGLLRSIGEPPPLSPGIFLANRDAACAKLKEVFAWTVVQLKLETHYPDQVVDFVAAYLAALDDESRADALGRCLVISGTDAWNAIAAQRDKHILVADSALDLSGETGTKLIQRARRAGHTVIFGGSPGGIPDPTSTPLPPPRSHQLKQALEEAGYSEERARTLAQKSGGNLGSLLRCIQNVSLMPEWAEGSPAAELAIAELLGSWSEQSEADRAVVEGVSGNPYGEWIKTMREIALRPGTPLTQRDGAWKFGARYEGWFALGPRLFDEHLERLRNTAVVVLRQEDPKFELPPEERYASSIHGKVLANSHLLRNGLAESLALLGSHPEALTSCTLGKAEATAVLAVREILAGASWVQWASLNDLLPLLAEAAPGEFFDAVEGALNSDPCPFDDMFRQEGDGLFGGTYMSGLLWAFETLAWDGELLGRAVICLGELAARDPGGRWTNRPANSLTTILLPWLPQTCATVAGRGAAVATLLAELPDVGWKLLLSLLPQSHSASAGTRKPAWRETIPADWSKDVTRTEYWEQVALYADLAIGAAKNDPGKLAGLIDRLEALPPSANEQVLEHLGSDLVMALPQADRLGLWSELVDLVTKHRKFADADWAMQTVQLDKIAALAERLAPDAPAFRHQRLFSERDFDLHEEKGSYEDQSRELEKRRERAVLEVAETGGTNAVLTFAVSVQSPWRVGISFGFVAGLDIDGTVLPDLLHADNKSLGQFAGGFVWGRFRSRGWPWVDEVLASRWAPAQTGQLLAYLPFVPETWERSARLLEKDESPYWAIANVNPYEANTGLELAVDQLIGYGRPHAAIRCLHRMLGDKQPLDNARTVRALLAALDSPEPSHAMNAYETVEIIKTIQDAPGTSPDDLFRVEWAYLPLLDRQQDASPRFLEQRLASEPGFFCEVLRLVFRSKKEDRATEESSAQAKNIATNAYRLLSEWRNPPGFRADGTYDGDALPVWMDAVKKECSDTGHLEIAMTMVGHALIHVPPDADGLWIHRSAAAALNARDAGDMRTGFGTELFNSRGVHFVDPTGKPERELAIKYRAQAEAVEGAGYHRLATTLRELATSYEREAERVSTRESFDD